MNTQLKRRVTSVAFIASKEHPVDGRLISVLGALVAMICSRRLVALPTIMLFILKATGERVCVRCGIMAAIAGVILACIRTRGASEIQRLDIGRIERRVDGASVRTNQGRG